MTALEYEAAVQPEAKLRRLPSDRIKGERRRVSLLTSSATGGRVAVEVARLELSVSAFE